MRANEPTHLAKGSARVADEIRRQIYKGFLRTGDKLLAEKDLLVHFGVSRPTLREALRLLEAEGLINIMRGGGGARVRPPSEESLVRQVGGYLQRQGANLEDIYAARLMIEPMVARLLAENADKEAVNTLENHIELMRNAVGPNDLYRVLINEFSDLITDYCGNKTISLLSKTIHQLILHQIAQIGRGQLLRSVPDPRAAQEESLAGRAQLVQAVRERNSDEAARIWLNELEKDGALLLSAFWSNMPIDVIPSGTDPNLKA